MANRYMKADFFFLQKNASKDEIDRLLRRLSTYNTVICGIHQLKQSPSGKYGVDSSIGSFLEKINDKKRIVCLFGNPYALSHIQKIESVDGLLVAYQENTITQELAAQALFGAIDATGRLPVNVNSEFKLHDGIDIKKNFRLKYSIPEESGISTAWLSKQIDSLALLGLERKAYPGCQILIAKNGNVIFNKCYGYLTYDDIEPVTEETLYDLASMTKIAGATLALLKLHGDKNISLDRPFSQYLPNFKESDKNRMTVRQMLSHQARLLPGIDFWRRAMTTADSAFFSTGKRPDFQLRVASNLYTSNKMKDFVYEQIRDSRLLQRAQYTYSDLAFILIPEIVDTLAGVNYEDFLKRTFYIPLGANNLTYNPLRYHPKSVIAPTEDDNYFRHETIRGFVHDEGAAVLGGVSGNAGLFSNANDIAKLMQMYLQDGFYGGVQYLEPASIKEFTRIQFPENNNRRGLGFDKPNINNYLYRPENSYPAPDASPDSFGHSGFTGTFTWADPSQQFFLVFLSNRTYPSRANTRLQELTIRAQMLQTIYDGIKLGANL